jgi:hypothetical protein
VVSLVKTVNFPPIRNGIDYLVSVVELLQRRKQASPGERSLKYAVLHLQAAVEVLLKARLQMKDWTLIVVDAAKTDESRFRQGNFASINRHETLRRLDAVLGIKIEQKDKDALEVLGRLRNSLQHWGLTATKYAVETGAADVLDFLIRFLDEELLQQLSPDERRHIDNDMNVVRKGLANIREFVRIRMDRLRGELADRLHHVVQCPDCRQFALVIAASAGSCRFCTRGWDDPEELLRGYVANILGFGTRDSGRMGEEPVEACLACGAETLVVVVTAAGPELTYLCFTCAESYSELTNCIHCGRLFVPNDDAMECEGCAGRFDVAAAD